MLRASSRALIVAPTIGLALTASSAPAASPCQPTRSDSAGFFLQSGIAAPRRAKIGTGHVLNGRVLRASDCAPVARALVVFWQAGANGYRSPGRGSGLTGRAGRFRFEAPVPAAFGGAQPHIHIAVIHPDYEELLTRYVVRRGEKSGRVRLILTPLL